MSSNDITEPLPPPSSSECDLIDLHVGSPILPTRTLLLPSSSPPPNAENEEIFDNLIDSELPILEKRLQNIENIPSSSRPRPPSVDTIDIEDILITINDDDDDEKFNSIPIRRSTSENLINTLSSAATRATIPEKSLSCDNLEALNVLASLDAILNASLLESDKFLDGEATSESVEACLLDLDNYLQACESATDSSSSSLQDSESESVLRQRLRQFEENYSRFLASGYVNRGYLDDDDRPLSACTRRIEAWRPNRASTIAALTKKERPTVLHRRASSSRCDTSARVPETDSNSNSNSNANEEEIDWSWVQDVARDVGSERRAHAAGDYCTGTVVVEPLHGGALTAAAEEAEPAMAKDELRVSPPPPPPPGAGGSISNTWLRTSMRRLQHFRLPSEVERVERLESAAAAGVAGNLVQEEVQVVDVALVRPVSAPSRLSAVQRSRSREREPGVSSEPGGGRARSSSASSRSRRPRSVSSSGSSVASTVDSTPSCTPAASPTHVEVADSQNNQRSQRRPCDNARPNDMPDYESPLGQWPHSLSSMMACLGCTLGLFNICRFAILSIHFGANFIVQFFILSLVFGLPLFTLQLCLGQQLGAGVVDMWRISPIFQGIGVALLVFQSLLGLYSIVGVSWMFVYFRDSFITKTDRYRWAEPFLYYRDGVQVPNNGSVYKLTETIPDYFSGIVLQRHHLPTGGSAYGTIKFQLAFNLAVVWMIVFVLLSKGLRSYGKVIYVFTSLPVVGTFVLCAKILGLMPHEYLNVTFTETAWSEFFLNSKSWLAAAQEVFLTWGVLGAAVMQIASHNKNKHLLQRDSSLVAVITFTVLLLFAFLASTCVQILRSRGYHYLPNSFEQMSSYTFLRSANEPLPANLNNMAIRHMKHNSFFVGEKVVRPGVDHTVESGYQVLRLATELFPATLAVLGADKVSPFWAVLFYFVLILFGIAQQLAIWHSVITGIMAIRVKVLRSWETTITLFSCTCGFILGLPMATEVGIFVVYFMDFTVGGMWWTIVIIVLQIVAVFVVRGRPYSGDTVVTALFPSRNHPCIVCWAPALLSFSWNVILPVSLMTVSIATFKNENFREIFVWHHAPFAEYWPLWARQVGAMIQLVPVLLVPVVSLIQSYRFLNNGPNDILEEYEDANYRIQRLYRPAIGEHMTDLQVHEAAVASLNNNSSTNAATLAPAEDPPPKYTPPPSYSTATGARIAKFLRQSIRRSVRRLANVLGESSGGRQRAGIIEGASAAVQPPPPDYNAVLVEMSQTTSNSTDLSIIIPEASNSEEVAAAAAAAATSNVRVSTLERLRNIQPTPGSPTLTAAEVASILRNSFRRSTGRRMVSRSSNGNSNNGRSNASFSNDEGNASLSAENLVESAAPIGETSLVLELLPNNNNNNNCSGNDSGDLKL